MSKLNIDLRVGDTIIFDNGRVQVTLSEKSGQRARLEINAKEDVVIKTVKINNAAEAAKSGINFNSNRSV